MMIGLCTNALPCTRYIVQTMAWHYGGHLSGLARESSLMKVISDRLSNRPVGSWKGEESWTNIHKRNLQNKLSRTKTNKSRTFSQRREICTKKLDGKAKTLSTRPFHNGRSSWRWVGRACRRGRWLARPTTPPPTSSHHHSTATRPPTPGHSSSPITILTISNITRQPFFDCQQWTPNTSTDSSSYLIQ